VFDDGVYVVWLVGGVGDEVVEECVGSYVGIGLSIYRCLSMLWYGLVVVLVGLLF